MKVEYEVHNLDEDARAVVPAKLNTLTQSAAAVAEFVTMLREECTNADAVIPNGLELMAADTAHVVVQEGEPATSSGDAKGDGPALVSRKSCR